MTQFVLRTALAACAALGLAQVAAAGDLRPAAAKVAAADSDCNCTPLAARGSAKGGNARGVKGSAFGGFGLVLPSLDADVYGEVDQEDQTVVVTILAIGFGNLMTEVVDCCIQGDTVQADYSIIGLAGSNSDSNTFVSPDTAVFNDDVLLFALVTVKIQYPELTVFPAGFDVLSGFSPN